MAQPVTDLDTIFGGNSELLVVCYGNAEYYSEEIDVLVFIVVNLAFNFLRKMTSGTTRAFFPLSWQ